MSGSKRKLAHSRHCEILHEYETVWLIFQGRTPVVIGDFYGDPEVAIIDIDERWCCVAGLGLILYFIGEPFEEYESNRQTSQYFELGREGPEKWWVEAVQQLGPFEIQVRLESGAVHRVSFRRTSETCEYLVS